MRKTIEPVGWREVGVCAVGGALPAVLMFVMSVLQATDGSNDTHRDFSDLAAGIAFGVPVALSTWVVATTGLILAALLFYTAQRILDAWPRRRT